MEWFTLREDGGKITVERVMAVVLVFSRLTLLRKSKRLAIAKSQKQTPKSIIHQAHLSTIPHSTTFCL